MRADVKKPPSYNINICTVTPEMTICLSHFQHNRERVESIVLLFESLKEATNESGWRAVYVVSVYSVQGIRVPPSPSPPCKTTLGTLRPLDQGLTLTVKSAK